jgi:hypothetical protein
VTLPIMPLLLLVGSTIGLTALLRAWRWARRPVWVGGTALAPSTMRYVGNALSALLWEPMRRPRVPGAAIAPGIGAEPARRDERGSAPLYQEELPLSPRRSVLELANYSVNRFVSRIVTASDWFGNRFQNGDVRNYLIYMFVIVMLVLILLAVTR